MKYNNLVRVETGIDYSPHPTEHAKESDKELMIKMEDNA